MIPPSSCHLAKTRIKVILALDLPPTCTPTPLHYLQLKIEILCIWLGILYFGITLDIPKFANTYDILLFILCLLYTSDAADVYSV